jgi:hypothetical protein
VRVVSVAIHATPASSSDTTPAASGRYAAASNPAASINAASTSNAFAEYVMRSRDITSAPSTAPTPIVPSTAP